MAQMVKNLSAMQETWVQSLSWEDPLEKGVATHSGILAWRSPRIVHGKCHGYFDIDCIKSVDCFG